MPSFLSKWTCMQKGVFFCAVISIFNFALIISNRYISNQILNWQLNQEGVSVKCHIKAEE